MGWTTRARARVEFWGHSFFTSFLVLSLLSTPVFLPSALAKDTAVKLTAPPASCHQALVDLRWYKLQVPGARGTNRPLYISMKGSTVPIAHAMEKEGLFYSDIATWFDRIDPVEFRNALTNVLKDIFPAGEIASKYGEAAHRALLRWLSDYPTRYRIPAVSLKPSEWVKLTPEEQVDYLSSRENPFDVINPAGRDELFALRLLYFSWLKPSQEAPAFVEVGDDVNGSYELRSARGEADRTQYFEQRVLFEAYLEGLIGHQHFVHAWPTSAVERARIAPQYIELIDSLSWMLYWRQARRSPNEADSILGHRYLGVYSNAALNRLEAAMNEDDPKKFNNKFRMVGARNFSMDPSLPGQTEGGQVVDWEMRSGNKGIKREFVEDLIEARLWSGDYNGVQSYHQHRDEFDPSRSIREHALRFLSEKQLAVVEEFEQKLPQLRWSAHGLAHNHMRNKLLAPLFRWDLRIPSFAKVDILRAAQERYAIQLFEVAKEYLRKYEKVEHNVALGELRSEMVGKLEQFQYQFARRVSLEEDFERYLIPRPTGTLPTITVPYDGKINPNLIDLGIEYSFRFPDRPLSRDRANERLKSTAEMVKKYFEAIDPIGTAPGLLEELDSTGHGHNLGIRYRYTRANGEIWRIEWDGINRSYTDDGVKRSRSGHIEVPSPKKSPADPEEVRALYLAMRELGQVPRRGAGGAHVNIDLAPLVALGPRQGARKAANLIAYFESNRDMIQFLWQHPFRVRAALAVEQTPELVAGLNSFSGEWNELGTLLYEQRYFNPYITRKPGYAQLNATALMSGAIPKAYQKTIDIKDPAVKWFPAFGGKGKDRLEFRLFDAPTDEYMAALQVKYVRALLNQALNAPGTVKLKAHFTAAQVAAWKNEDGSVNGTQFAVDAIEHFKELGLDPKEFRMLVLEAIRMQEVQPAPRPPLEKFRRFLPAEK